LPKKRLLLLEVGNKATMGQARRTTPPQAVLFDRDGTLVVDVAYNGDPERVTAMPTARATVRALHAAHVPVGVISNQSGIGRGILTAQQVESVNERIEVTLGPFDVWEVCPHTPEDDCRCRKPKPGMVFDAARRLGVAASRLAVIGDIAADVEAAQAAGAVGVLVPTDRTRRSEVQEAALVASDLAGAVTLLFERTALP
jgi:D-glycero-D-manno-heptose 1,7-bisphosphate phosphatase